MRDAGGVPRNSNLNNNNSLTINTVQDSPNPPAYDNVITEKNNKNLHLNKSVIKHDNKELNGGDINNLVSETDIDNIFKQYIPPNQFKILPSNTSVRQPYIKHHITNAAKEGKQIIFAFWCRFHWLLCIINGNQATFYDSAPSPAVRRDVTKFCQANGVTATFPSCPRQFRFSNECGIFTICNGILKGKGRKITEEANIISLNHIRTIISQGREIKDEDLAPLEMVGGGEVNWKGVHDTHERAMMEKRLCFMLTAMIMINAAKELLGREVAGITRSRIVNTATKLGFVPNTENDMMEAIEKLAEKEELPIKISYTGEHELITRGGSENIWINAHTADDNWEPPSEWRTVLSAKYQTDSMQTSHDKLTKHARSGHYQISDALDENIKLLVRDDPAPIAPKKKKTAERRELGLTLIKWKGVNKEIKEFVATSTSKASEWKVNSEKCKCGGWKQFNETITIDESNGNLVSRKKFSGNYNTCICELTTKSQNTINLNKEINELRNDLIRTVMDDADPLGPKPLTSSMKGSAGQTWHIYESKPPHIHNISWNAKAHSTRLGHIAMLKLIKAMPTDIVNSPFPTAVVDMILRRATAFKWAWSTISTKLATAKSALRDLPLYTNEPKGIDLSSSPIFNTSAQRAQKLARIHATRDETITKGMDSTTYNGLVTQKGMSAAVRLLLAMSWHFAARVGDMRTVEPGQIKFPPNNTPNLPTSVTFTKGKGGAFWGPFTIKAIIPHQLARDMAEFTKERKNNEELWYASEQRSLSTIISNLNLDLNLRSIRRGALLDHAGCGASDNQLILLSGHKREDTLYRYLGWGTASASAEKAAIEREELRNKAASKNHQTKANEQPADEYTNDNTNQEDDNETDDAESLHGAGLHENETQCTKKTIEMEPKKMSYYSGKNGTYGQRVQRPPNFFCERPPSSIELGIKKTGPSTLPLHLKDVGKVDWEIIQTIARNGDYYNEILKAKEWMTVEPYRGMELSKGRKPIYNIKFTPEQIRQMWEMERIEPVTDSTTIKAYVNTFGREEPEKNRQRVISEPWINRITPDNVITRIRFNSRFERRAEILNKRYVIQFDKSAFYDQFEFESEARDYFGLKSKGIQLDENNPKKTTHWRLTRLPMGGKFSTAVAQSVTWALTEGIRSNAVSVTTMIDNVRIASDDPQAFTTAVRQYLSNVRDAGITLNENTEGWDDNHIIRIGEKGSTEDFTFLGETYNGNTIRNTDKLINKLQEAMKQLKEGVTTRRNLASVVGLSLFMAHTININIAEHGGLIKAYANLFNGTPDWDAPLHYLDDRIINKLHDLANIILPNKPVQIIRPEPPGTKDTDYDAVLIIDACANAWAAKLRIVKTGKTYQILKAFHVTHGYSAHAEPLAVTEALRYIKQAFPDLKRIALVTDHVAIPNGQRRWWSRYGGFSTAYHLNEAFKEMYNYAEAFHVEGINNIADSDSRSIEAAKAKDIVCNEIDIVWPPLETFSHPYIIRPPIKGF